MVPAHFFPLYIWAPCKLLAWLPLETLFWGNSTPNAVMSRPAIFGKAQIGICESSSRVPARPQAPPHCLQLYLPCDCAALSADTRYVLTGSAAARGEVAGEAISADKHSVYAAIHLH